MLAACTGAQHGKDHDDGYAAAVEALRRGELATALKTIAAASPGATKVPADAARFRLLEAEVLLFRRDPAAAQPLLAEPIPQTSNAAALRARQRYLQGQALLIQGRLADASSALDDAYMQATAAGAFEPAFDARALRGQILLRQSQWQAAESELRGALASAEQAGDEYRQMVALHNLGMGHLLRRRWDEALPWFERVLAFTRLEAYTVYATALTNTAACYARLGEFARSIAALQRAVKVHEKNGAQTYLEQAMGELGNTYLLQGNYEEGIARLQRALDLAKQVNATADASLWAVSLTSTFIEQEKWADAARYNAEAKALNAALERRPTGYQLLNDAHIAAGEGRSGDAMMLYDDARKAAAGDVVVDWLSHAGAGRVDLAAGRTAAASRHFEQALTLVERTRAGLIKADYRLSIQARLVTLYREYVDMLVEQKAFERALAVADSSRARVLAERFGVNAPLRPDPAALRRAAAGARATFLFYWLGPRKSYAWVVTPSRIEFVPLAATSDSVAALVRQHQDSLITAVADVIRLPQAPGDALYASVLAPVVSHLPRDSRVIVVPDGALTRVNFDTLPVDGERRHYLIEDFEIAVAPSLAMIATPAEAAVARERNLLLIGDAVSADAQYPALRYASTEMSAVADAFAGRAAVFKGADASPVRYRDVDPRRFDVVHFTAHAAANAESPLDSAVILSRDASGYKLYARDVADLPLSADLVTISACRSAGERTYAGEGLVGFAWAFLRAGAKRVVAGLWDVDDRSTADLMRDMYARLASGASPGASLRAAKLAMIARGGTMAKPYYWGPFQLFVGSTVVP